MKRNSRAAVFVDKDGTLVRNVPYNVDPALLCFEPGALQALAECSQAGYAIVVVSNQSGVARGYFSLRQLDTLRRALTRRLREESGVRLAGFFACPHAPDEQGRPQCQCRKPLPGLLLQAANAHGLVLERSWMVGDTLDDVEAGRRAGCRSILYDSGGETLWEDAPLRRPQARLSDWMEVAHEILASGESLPGERSRERARALSSR